MHPSIAAARALASTQQRRFRRSSQSVRISFVDQDLQEFNREAIRPNRLAVRHFSVVSLLERTLIQPCINAPLGSTALRTAVAFRPRFAYVLNHFGHKRSRRASTRRGEAPLYGAFIDSSILLNEKTSAVRSRISSKLIFASCVGYFDRAYY